MQYIHNVGNAGAKGLNLWARVLPGNRDAIYTHMHVDMYFLRYWFLCMVVHSGCILWLGVYLFSQCSTHIGIAGG
jgi:hypothetical protein